MTSRTERCIGLACSREVAEGACRICLHAVSIPCISSARGVGFVVCSMNQMDYRKYEEDSDSCLHNKMDERRL